MSVTSGEGRQKWTTACSLGLQWSICLRVVSVPCFIADRERKMSFHFSPSTGEENKKKESQGHLQIRSEKVTYKFKAPHFHFSLFYTPAPLHFIGISPLQIKAAFQIAYFVRCHDSVDRTFRLCAYCLRTAAHMLRWPQLQYVHKCKSMPFGTHLKSLLHTQHKWWSHDLWWIVNNYTSNSITFFFFPIYTFVAPEEATRNLMNCFQWCDALWVM